MIVSMADFSVMQDEHGFYLEKEGHDLDQEKISIPIMLHDGLGVLDVYKRRLIIHPANAESFQLTVEEFVYKL